MRTIWIITILAMACSADAGPWLRPDGEGFMSVDSIGSVGRDQGDLRAYSSIYVEYGLSEKTTVGLIVGQDQQNTRDVTAYLRHPLVSPWPDWIMAYDFGIGARMSETKSEPHLRLGFSLGRGGLFDDESGWAQLDTFMNLRANAQPFVKLETTLGNRGRKDWLYLLQFRAERPDQSAWIFTIAPSLAVPLSKARHIQVGLSADTESGGRFGINAALWRGF